MISSSSKRRIIGSKRGQRVALLTVATAIGVAIAAATTASSAPRVPPPGSPAALLPEDKRALAEFARSGRNLTGATVLAVRGGRAYYQVANSDGQNCYAVGPVGGTDYLLGQIECVPDFPSEARPVLDFTVVHGGLNPGEAARVYRSEGFTADTVAAIGFTTTSGQLVHVTPVTDNIYSVTAPPTADVSQLVALDSSRKVIWSQQIAH